MSLVELDQWIGKTLFVPPIIKLCQLTRQSQFAVARLFWFIAALDGLYHAKTVFGAAIWAGMSVVMMVTAARRADSPTASFRSFRLLGLMLLVLDLLRGAATAVWAGTEFWFIVLIAEYASTIRTLPPIRKPQRSSTNTEPVR
jgi:hypothetical protein